MAVNQRKYEILQGWTDSRDFENSVNRFLSTFAKYDARIEGGIQIVFDPTSPSHRYHYYQAVSRTINIVEQ